VLIRGQGLTGATTVKFGFNESPTVVVHSDTELATMSPPSLSGGNALVTVYANDIPSNSLTFNYLSRMWAGDRRSVFFVEVAYLLLLLVLGAAYASWPAFKNIFSTDLAPIPIIIPWFAALGGVTISLSAVFRHTDDWDPTYFFWHVVRPFIAIVLGSIAYLIFLGGILATGTTGVVPATPKNPIEGVSYDVIAFVAGYREEVLRSLIKRVVDLLLNPSGNTIETTKTTTVTRTYKPAQDGGPLAATREATVGPPSNGS
jgi:hypothetical protein